MGYTGDVEVGGPADVRQLPGLTISKLAVSEMANNAYLLRDPDTGEAVLIDAAAEPEALRALIGDAAVHTVVTTHGHWDHHRALPQVVEATGAVTVAHPADADDLPVPVQRPVVQGDTVRVGGQTLEVIHLRCSGAGRRAPARTCSPATAWSRGVREGQQARTTSIPSWTTWRSGSSAASATRHGSIRDTGRTARSEPSGPTWRSGGRGAGSGPHELGCAEPGRGTEPAGSGPGRVTDDGAGARDPGPVTETGQAIAPVGASWRGIDGTPAPVHAHMVQW
jgi:hypothetical protein